MKRGAIATIEGFRPGELQQRQTEFVQPEVQQEKKKKKESPFVSISIRLLPDQKAVVRQALEAMKEIQGIEGRSWHGTAIELICADFLAGVGFKRAILEAQNAKEQ